MTCHKLRRIREEKTNSRSNFGRGAFPRCDTHGNRVQAESLSVLPFPSPPNFRYSHKPAHREVIYGDKCTA